MSNALFALMERSKEMKKEKKTGKIEIKWERKMGINTNMCSTSTTVK